MAVSSVLRRTIFGVSVSLFLLSPYAFSASIEDNHQALNEVSVNSVNNESSESNNEVTSSQNALSILQKMSKAIQEHSYGLVFMSANNTGFEALRYTFGHIDHTALARLDYLEGPERKIIMRDGIVGYFQQGSPAFSLKGERIIDGLPAIIYADFDKISSIYNFMLAGQSRAAGQECILIRVIDKKRSRYSQLLCIDENNSLPLRVDYLDDQGELIEQFKVTTLLENNQINSTLSSVERYNFPPLLVHEAAKDVQQSNWDISWLPDGFKEISRFNQQISDGSFVESRMYSDGVFTFNINVSPVADGKNVPEENVIKGTRLIHSEKIGKFKVIFIGDLPFDTVEHIVESFRPGVTKMN